MQKGKGTGSWSHRFISSKEAEWTLKAETEDFALKMDQEDELRNFRQLFSYPLKKDLPHVDLSCIKYPDEEAIYFCGHSLGLPLKNMESYLHEMVKNWSERGVHSHFYGYLPSAYCDLPLKEKMADIVGAEVDEIAIMNSLTVNIHVLLCSFYNPTPSRYKILMIDQGFPSDRFAVESQVRLKGYRPEDAIIFQKPRKGEDIFNMREICATIEKNKEIALVFFEGVHYYTGQLFDMRSVTEVAHKHGCIVGFDLAHAVGNVKLQLHDWDVDFALWCTYKYMNSGAGSLSAVFVNNKFTQEKISDTFPMLRGWWGMNNHKKFDMGKEFLPADGADRFKMSNPSPFLAIMLLANLEVFYEAGMDSLVKKQAALTGYLEYLIGKYFPETAESNIPRLSIITPKHPTRRGCQLSLRSAIPLDLIQQKLMKRGIVCDIRLPSVMRVTPAPLYNSFSEVLEFVQILHKVFLSFSNQAKIEQPLDNALF